MSSTGGNSATVSGSISSPRIDRSWATKVATGTGWRWGASSAHVWSTATTSDSGPIVNRPASPSSTVAAHSGGASSASRYSASVAAGHSWRPVSRVAAAQRSRSLQQPGPVVARAAGVDEPHETVEVDGVDQGVEWLVVTHAFRRAARGSGGPSGRTGTHPTPPSAVARYWRALISSSSSRAATSTGTRSAMRATRSSSALVDRFAGELPDHGAQLERGAEAQAVVDRPHPVVGQQAVPRLAVGVVGEHVEHGDLAQLGVVMLVLLVDREVVLACDRRRRTTGTSPRRTGRRGSRSAARRRCRAAR